jgi:polar amino acid transport system substrate-binding protein
MIRFLCRLALSSLFILSIVCKSSPTLAEDTSSFALIPAIQRIQASGELKIGLPPFETLPFYYHDKTSGDLVGYDIDVATRLAQRLGVIPIFDQKSTSFDDLVIRSGIGEVDIAIGKLGITYPRISSSIPYTYLEFNQALMINRKALSKVGSEQDDNLGEKILQSKLRVGTIDNSAYSNYVILNFPNIINVGFKNWTNAVDALLNHEVDAIYRDLNEMKILVTTRPNLNIDYAIVNIVDGLDKKAIYIGQDSSDLGPFVNHLIADEFGVPDSKEIMVKYSYLFQS